MHSEIGHFLAGRNGTGGARHLSGKSARTSAPQMTHTHTTHTTHTHTHTRMPSLKLPSLLCQNQGSLRHRRIICLSQREKTYPPFGSPPHFKVPKEMILELISVLISFTLTLTLAIGNSFQGCNRRWFLGSMSGCKGISIFPPLLLDVPPFGMALTLRRWHLHSWIVFRMNLKKWHLHLHSFSNCECNLPLWCCKKMQIALGVVQKLCKLQIAPWMVQKVVQTRCNLHMFLWYKGGANCTCFCT